MELVGNGLLLHRKCLMVVLVSLAVVIVVVVIHIVIVVVVNVVGLCLKVRRGWHCRGRERASEL